LSPLQYILCCNAAHCFACFPCRSHIVHKEPEAWLLTHGTCEVEVFVSCRGPTHVRNRECASHGYHANKECVLMSACQGSLAERWTSAHLGCSPQRRLCEVLELEQVALCRWAPSHGQRQRCFWASHAQRRWTSTRMVSCCGSYLLGKHLQEEI